MAVCDRAHAEFDHLANGAVQVGTLPKWMRIQGKVAWYVAQGPLSEMSKAWQTFMQKLEAAHPGRLEGPPGDVSVCPPEEHAKDGQRKLLMIIYFPLA